MTATREIHLVGRPSGAPTPDLFEIIQVELPDPAPGEVQVRNRWISVDPYMRGKMNAGGPAPYALGTAMAGRSVGEVTVSNAPGLGVGDWVFGDYGWREGYNAPADKIEKLTLHGLPPHAFLSGAGAPGLTAYAGLLRTAEMKPGDVVFVSAAAGAVGSMACQIAKLRGHTVIGSAGGERKLRFLVDELKIDAAIDYKQAQGSLAQALRHAAPGGIDVYFENVGGEHLEAAIDCAKPGGRVAICGMVSTYNAATPPPGPRNLMQTIGKGLTLRGFNVSQHMDMRGEFLAEVAAWHAQGKLKLTETVVEDLEAAPDAFIGLFRGENLGKMLVRVG
ncbi:NADP-dependent oxidoreductase [Phenylobacterium sp.]|uniref:NADP-dependent oxidoreductase n=1 Tax=Phenylobacterium sp. TaxID=1871053 RepID=UPI0027358E66|nr:NADP-dependent oxidoreductase [Phenylobacterium sp.]MDP3660796.1 NADP-dependent oxidoreductase [Phenylobacterium sp.]